MLDAVEPAGSAAPPAPADHAQPMPVDAAVVEAPVVEAAVVEAAVVEDSAVHVPHVVDDAGQDLLFRNARTRWHWTSEPVGDDVLRQLYDLLKMGPTSGNCSPARFLFLRTDWSKQRLRPALSAGNVDKAIAAPVVCIVAHDPKFYEDLPRLAPGTDARGWYAGNDELANETAFRNGTLQGAYLMMAARAVGLDCGPMSGFDNATIDQEFLVAQGWKSNFLVALGHADDEGVAERAPRLTFDEACRLL